MKKNIQKTQSDPKKKEEETNRPKVRTKKSLDKHIQTNSESK
jgi:hypothetical protein